MERTLSDAREQFVKVIVRDTHTIEQPRLVAVLDSMIAWSNKHPNLLRFRETVGTAGTIAFEHVQAKTVVWEVTQSRRDIPRLELMPKATKTLTPEARATLADTLNANMREPILPTEPLRIGFGALKNPAALKAVQVAMEKYLTSKTA